MIRYYLDTVTVGYFNDHDLPPDDVQEYEPQVRQIERKLAKSGDGEKLQLAFAYLLQNNGFDLETLNGGRYPFDADEMREIIKYCYETLFSKEKSLSEEEVMKIKIVK